MTEHPGGIQALKPEHANKIQPIAGTEFSVERRLVGYAYPNHGNLHNPTPRYHWNLLLDGRVVDHDESMRKLVAAARRPNAAAEYRDTSSATATAEYPTGYRCPVHDRWIPAYEDHPPLRRTATGKAYHIPRRDDPEWARCGRHLVRHGSRRTRRTRPVQWCTRCDRREVGS